MHKHLFTSLSSMYFKLFRLVYIKLNRPTMGAYGTTQVDHINMLRREGLLEPELVDIFEALRRKGNLAMHEAGYGKTEEAKAMLYLAFRLSIWFMEVYGDWDFQAPEYIELQEQETVDAERLQKEYEDKVKQLEEELEKVRQQAETEQPDVKTERKKISKNFVRRHQLTEAETRTITLKHVPIKKDIIKTLQT